MTKQEMNIAHCGGIEHGGLGATGIIGRNGAQPLLGIAKGLAYLSRGKQNIVDRGVSELSIVQAQVDRKLSKAHAMQCAEYLKPNIIYVVKRDRAPR